MQPHSIPAPAEDDERIEQAILNLMLHEAERGPGIWATEDLAREIGDAVVTADALRRLQGDGLIHRVADDFAILSRAAITAARLAG